MERPWLSHYEDGVSAEIEIPDVPVTENLTRAAAAYPNRPAMIFGNVVEPLGNMLVDATIEYREFLDLTHRFAAALQELGVERGDRVAVHLPNCPQFVVAYYATLMVGGIVVPCNPQYVGREIEHQ
ncbi:MAG: AMP-binding protein, partial [Anaerolineae bacterium]